MKTLYVHVGHPKTGTTALQSLCRNNASELSARGIAFPSMPMQVGTVPPSRNGAFLVTPILDAEGNRLHSEELARIEKCLDVVEASFGEHDAVLLTDEAIWGHVSRDDDAFWEPLEARARRVGFDIKIIVYLRRQDLFCTSWYNQCVLAGNFPYDWDRWVRRLSTSGMTDQYGTLNKFARHVGRDNIDVGLYDRKQLERDGGSIYSDFLARLGIVFDEKFEIPEARTNSKSLTPNYQECLRAVNASPLHSSRSHPLMRKCAIRLSVTDDAPRMSMFSTAAARDFLAQFEDDNDRIAREYLHRDGPLHSQEFPEVTEWKSNNEWMAVAVTRFFLEVNRRQNMLIEEMAATRGSGDAAGAAASAEKAAGGEGAASAEEAAGAGAGAAEGAAAGEGAASAGGGAAGEGAGSEAAPENEVLWADCEWEALDWEDEEGSREEDRFSWVARCAADFFLLRQDNIEAGVPMTPLDDETVLCLLHSLMPQANTEVQLLGRFKEERARVLATRGTVTRLRGTITEKNATIANLNSVIDQLEQALMSTPDARLRRVIGRILRAPRSLGRRIAEETRAQAAADTGRTDEHEE